jgi:O-antigen/teichoic acid export membrane protein
LSAVVIFATRAFQYAWPPLAYSIEDDAQARRFYALVATYYVLVSGIVVAALALLGRWAVRLLAAPAFFPAHRALPWVALGWALYGLFLVLVVMAGRARVTTRNFPAALAGLAANAGLLVVLVPRLGIAGAGIALCGAYVVMLLLMYALSRRLFPVPFEWGRLAHLVAVIGGATVAGELLLPTAGAAAFAERLAVLAAIPVLLAVTGFLGPGERRRLAALARRLAPAAAR